MTSPRRSEPQRYPLLQEAVKDGSVGDGSGLPDEGKREPRCGPWDEREDGARVCRKCGEVDWPGSYGRGPFGI